MSKRNDESPSRRGLCCASFCLDFLFLFLVSEFVFWSLFVCLYFFVQAGTVRLSGLGRASFSVLVSFSYVSNAGFINNKSKRLGGVSRLFLLSVPVYLYLSQIISAHCGLIVSFFCPR